MGTREKRLTEALLMNTHYICFNREIEEKICRYLSYIVSESVCKVSGTFCILNNQGFWHDELQFWIDHIIVYAHG